jgi:cell division protein FtsB
MSDDADLILSLLRAIRAKLDDHDRKLDELIVRVGRLEREIVNLHADFATISLRIDNLDRRVERIERRLDLVDESAG